VGEHSAEIFEQRKLMKARAPWRLAGVFFLATALVGMRLAAQTRLHPSPLWLIAPGAGLATVLLVVVIVRLSMRSLRLHGVPDPRRLQRVRIRVDLVSGGCLLLFGAGMGIAGSATGHPAVWFIAAFLMLFGVFVIAVAAWAARRAAGIR
jgi:hypothetical protein